MTPNRYTVGDLVRVKVAVDIVDPPPAVPIDPTAVALTMALPGGSSVNLTSSIVHDGVGLYHADYAPLQTGFYQYEWVGTGAAQAAAVGSFLVNQGPL
jgi:hypothetical protein